jgi:hypothetical protein
MRRALLVLLPLAACAGEGGERLAGCGGPVRVVNETRTAVEQLYLREPGTQGWGRDRLAPAGAAPTELAPGATYEGRVAAGPIGLRAVFVDGRASEVARIDLCGTNEIRLGAQAPTPRR